MRISSLNCISVWLLAVGCLFLFVVFLLMNCFCPSQRPEEAVPRTSCTLAVVVLTAPQDVDLRQLTRETWLSVRPDGVEYYFPVGVSNLDWSRKRELSKEQTRHGDLLLLEEAEESYGSLPRKMLETIKRLHQIVDTEFLLKVDVDSLVRLDALMMALDAVRHPRLYWGFFDGRAHVHRRGKWRETDWNLCDRYLPYALGGGYLVSGELLRFLATNAALLKLFSSEDVSMGAWLAGLDVHYVHDPRFDTEQVSRGCSDEYLVTHKQTPEDIRAKWTHLKATGRLCARQFRVRNSYAYDWSVPPSQCCSRSNNSSVP